MPQYNPQRPIVNLTPIRSRTMEDGFQFVKMTDNAAGFYVHLAVCDGGVVLHKDGGDFREIFISHGKLHKVMAALGLEYRTPQSPWKLAACNPLPRDVIERFDDGAHTGLVLTLIIRPDILSDLAEQELTRPNH